MNVLINLINLCFCRLVPLVLLVGLYKGQGGAVDVEKYLSLGGGGVVASDELAY